MLTLRALNAIAWNETEYEGKASWGQITGEQAVKERIKEKAIGSQSRRLILSLALLHRRPREARGPVPSVSSKTLT